jgi:hypothetical protein
MPRPEEAKPRTRPVEVAFNRAPRTDADPIRIDVLASNNVVLSPDGSRAMPRDGYVERKHYNIHHEDALTTGRKVIIVDHSPPDVDQVMHMIVSPTTGNVDALHFSRDTIDPPQTQSELAIGFFMPLASGLPPPDEDLFEEDGLIPNPDYPSDPEALEFVSGYVIPITVRRSGNLEVNARFRVVPSYDLQPGSIPRYPIDQMVDEMGTFEFDDWDTLEITKDLVIVAPGTYWNGAEIDPDTVNDYFDMMNGLTLLLVPESALTAAGDPSTVTARLDPPI